MKIGILTFHHSNYNYGAVLQTFSIYKLIETLGYESYIINYTPSVYSVRKKTAASIVAMLGFEFEKFRRRSIPRILHKTETADELKRLNEILDGFVVGSDQVWRYRTDTNSLYKYYLNFVDDEKVKIAYGASFGLNYWDADKETTLNVKKLVKRFDAISVREESGVKICKDIFGVESVNVLDPTLLLDKKYFHELADTQTKQTKQKYLAYMLLDDSKQNELFFREIASNNKFKFIGINGKKIWSKKNFFFFKSVNKWLNYIKHSEIVITDSFHCTVFSIIFRKKFICLANPHRGVTRLENLLKLLKLETHFCLGINQFEATKMMVEINYNEVEEILNKEKIVSINFLKNSLSLIKLK